MTSCRQQCRDTRGPDPPEHHHQLSSVISGATVSPCEVNIARIYTSSCQTAAWNQGILDQTHPCEVMYKSMHRRTDDLSIFYLRIDNIPGIDVGGAQDELPQTLHPADPPPQMVLGVPGPRGGGGVDTVHGHLAALVTPHTRTWHFLPPPGSRHWRVACKYCRHCEILVWKFIHSQKT